MLGHSPSRLEFISAEYERKNNPIRHSKTQIARNFPHVQQKVQNIYKYNDKSVKQ